MTTTAWDGVFLAADRLALLGGRRCRVRKIFDCGEYWYAGSGHSDDIIRIAEWITAGLKPSDRPVLEESVASGIAVRKADVKAFAVEGKHTVLAWIRERTYATGSGMDYAIAAMSLGKTAREAVLFASKFNAYTGLGVDSVEVKKAKK